MFLFINIIYTLYVEMCDDGHLILLHIVKSSETYAASDNDLPYDSYIKILNIIVIITLMVALTIVLILVG